jgi:hypothetical protein
MVIRGAKSKPIPGPPAKLIAAEQTTAKAAAAVRDARRNAMEWMSASRHFRSTWKEKFKMIDNNKVPAA